MKETQSKMLNEEDFKVYISEGNQIPNFSFQLKELQEGNDISKSIEFIDQSQLKSKKELTKLSHKWKTRNVFGHFPKEEVSSKC